MTRTEITWFAKQMEKKLTRRMAHREGWKDASPDALFTRLKEEVVELDEALIAEAPSLDIIDECVDVANFAMMIADNAIKEREDAERT